MVNQFLAHGLLPYGWAWNPERLAIAAAVTLGFALLARILRGVTVSGAVAGGLACFVLFVGAGPAAFATLAALFLMTWLATRMGYRRKQERGLAERREGRNGWQVLANLAVSGVAATLFGITGNELWLVAGIAALTEAATDTVASEIGQSSQSEARLITTWARVPAGIDGGVTGVGTLAGFAAGMVIAAIATLAGILTQAEMWIALAAGFGGMFVDSLLGATIQRRRWVSNQSVNLLATLAAAAMAFGIRSWQLAGGN